MRLAIPACLRAQQFKMMFDINIYCSRASWKTEDGNDQWLGLVTGVETLVSAAL